MEPALDRAYAKVTRRIVPLLVLAYVAAYLDRVNVGFAKLQMLHDLGFSETAYGLGAGIFFIGYFLFEVPSNLILHRVGARVWIARIMISWGLVSAMTLAVKTPAMFYLARFTLGVAEAGFFPGVILYLTYWFPAERRGRITALFMTGIAISNVVGSLLSGVIMQAFAGVNGWAGWQWLFLLEAAPSILMGVAILLWLDNRVGAAAWLEPDEKQLIEVDLARDAAARPDTSIAAAIANPRVWLCAAIYFGIVMGSYGLGFWMPSLIQDLGFKAPAQIGLLTAIPYSVGAVGMVLTGRSADRRGERRWHVAIPALAGGAGLVLSVLAGHNVVLALAALSLAAYGILTGLPLFWSLPTALLGGTAAAAGIALINSFGNLSGFVGPYLMGWTKDLTHSTATGMYVMAFFLVLGSLLVLVGMPARLVNR